VIFAPSCENSCSRTRAMLAVHFLRLDWARYLIAWIQRDEFDNEKEGVHTHNFGIHSCIFYLRSSSIVVISSHIMDNTPHHSYRSDSQPALFGCLIIRIRPVRARLCYLFAPWARTAAALMHKHIRTCPTARDI
jgi:hypothetical protein